MKKITAVICSVIFLLNYFNFCESVSKSSLLLMELVNLYTFRGSSSVISSTCKTQTDLYYNELTKGSGWALKMMDASSKFQSGLAMGNLFDLGSFDECINIKSDQNFQGKYCLAKIATSPSSSPNTLFEKELQLKQESLIHLIRHTNMITGQRYDKPNDTLQDDEPSFYSITWSICVPEGCTGDDVQNHLNKYFNLEKSPTKMIVKDSYCQMNPLQPKLSGGDWAVISFLIVIIVIIVCSTTYDIFNHIYDKESYHPTLIAFSWYTNGKKLLTIRKSDEQIPCLHGLRFLSMMWVIGGHQFVMLMMTPLINALDLVQWLSAWSSLITIGSTVSVDTFFCLSGCLLMYGFLKSRAKGIFFNIPLFYLHRYLRLTPALAVVMLIQMTIILYFGTGPIWTSTMPMSTKFCQDYWWSTLLYVQNYVNPNEICIGQGWYLQVDMQLFILSPLILLPIAYWPKYAKYIFSVLIVTFVLTPFGIAYYYQLDPGTNKYSSNAHYMDQYYEATQARAGTWIVGLALGYVLYNSKNKQILRSKALNALGWLITTIVMLYIVFGLYPNQQPDYVYNRWFASIFIGCHRVVWCFGLSWIIFSCVQGYGGPVNTILSLKMFEVLGRLSYSMYLTHFSLLTIEAATTRVPKYFSNISVIFSYWGTFAYTLILSIMWVLSFEYPVANLDVLLFSKASKPKNVPKKVSVMDMKQENSTENENEIDAKYVKVSVEN